MSYSDACVSSPWLPASQHCSKLAANTGAWPRFRALARSWANISIISKYALIVSALYSVPVGQSTEKIRQMGNFLRTKSVDAHITKGMTSYK